MATPSPQVGGTFSATAWSRRQLVGALATGASSALVPGLQGNVDLAGATAATPVPAGGLAERGILYDTGTDYVPGSGYLTIQTWDLERVARELAILRRDVHCNAVSIFGSDLDRLREGAEIALQEGLRVWIQPRPIDGDAVRQRAMIADTAAMADALREEYGLVGLNLGVELTIFSTGIVPGATFEERLGTLLTTFDKFQEYNSGLNELLADLRETARKAFDGPLTYGSGEWETVDWTDFDCVGVDLYIHASNRATYREQVQSLHRFGKPVLITEFGCCTYEGAEDAGGSGYEIVDWTTNPLRLNGEYVRSEQVQADTIISLLEIYQAEQVHGAYVFGFIEPEMTYDPDPRYDLDMASFGIVKALPAASGKGYEETGYWEPKLAFAELANAYQE